jgi:hypothetical protein
MTSEATRAVIRKAARQMAERRANLGLFDRDLPPPPVPPLTADMVGHKARRIPVQL